MKNYQKPMVNVEMINVEDVITTSTVTPADEFSATNKTWATGLGTSGMSGDNGTIVFEW